MIAMHSITQVGSVIQLVKTADPCPGTYYQLASLHTGSITYGSNNKFRRGSDTSRRTNRGGRCSRWKTFDRQLNSISCQSSGDDPRYIGQDIEIRVCTNKTCRKQGALQALEFFRSLSPPSATIETCGCLGKIDYIICL